MTPSPEKIASYFERAGKSIYAESEESFHQHLIPQAANSYFTPMCLPKDAYVLDVGCGPGQFMKLIEQDGYVNVFGVTMSEEEFAACGSMNAVMADMTDIPFADAHFDLVWCRHALEHSPAPLFALYEFERLLKPGGRIYVEVPCPDCQKPQEDNPNHYSVMGARMWMNLFLRAGLRIDSIKQFECDLQEKENPANRWRERSFIIEAHKPVKALLPLVSDVVQISPAP